VIRSRAAVVARQIEVAMAGQVQDRIFCGYSTVSDLKPLSGVTHRYPNNHTRRENRHHRGRDDIRESFHHGIGKSFRIKQLHDSIRPPWITKGCSA
jgi:hypothetical protein